MKRALTRLFPILLLIFALMLSGCSSSTDTPPSASEAPAAEEQTDMLSSYNQSFT